MNKGAKFALDGSLAGAVVYMLVTILTAWAAVLPPIPDEHYATLLAAMTAVLAALFQVVRRILVHVGWLPDKPAEEVPPSAPPGSAAGQATRPPRPYA
jgi:hypothetical protein